MLEKKFKTLCQHYSNNKQLIHKLWGEIQQTHSSPQRYYHTLKYLEDIDNELSPVSTNPLLSFATYYHDIVYDVTSSQNEEASARLAQKRLSQLTVPKALIQKVVQLIIETKTHKASTEENALFLDADLSILGSSHEYYELYTQNVRKEYAVYDDAPYILGRKKVLEFFLERERIYLTEYFYKHYEHQARSNIQRELKKL